MPADIPEYNWPGPSPRIQGLAEGVNQPLSEDSNTIRYGVGIPE